ncbi:rhodanese family protein [Francisellaceae bacterium]|nr:rhodanese family protein [Francisellaceae bacterium]
MSKCETISVSEFLDLNKGKDIKIVDIRNPDEFARESIKSAQNIPSDKLDECVLDKDDMVIFHCQAGNRTKQNHAKIEKLGLKKAYIMEGGILAWKKASQPLNVDQKAPLPVMRQVQIIVGFMVVIGVILALTISPWFSLISAFFGGGLLFAGLTGYCGMANVLLLIPYNQPKA